MHATAHTDAAIRRARFVRGGRDPATGLDCLGVVLVKLAQHGLALPDPWQQLADDWRAGLRIGVGALMPADWRQVPAASRPCDVLLVGGDRMGVAFFDGVLAWTAQPGAGVVRVPLERLPVVEVWRPATR